MKKEKYELFIDNLDKIQYELNDLLILYQEENDFCSSYIIQSIESLKIMKVIVESDFQGKTERIFKNIGVIYDIINKDRKD